MHNFENICCIIWQVKNYLLHEQTGILVSLFWGDVCLEEPLWCLTGNNHLKESCLKENKFIWLFIINQVIASVHINP